VTTIGVDLGYVRLWRRLTFVERDVERRSPFAVDNKSRRRPTVPPVHGEMVDAGMADDDGAVDRGSDLRK